jgi:hypothetical protein
LAKFCIKNKNIMQITLSDFSEIKLDNELVTLTARVNDDSSLKFPLRLKLGAVKFTKGVGRRYSAPQKA